jgi:hypothetical protein
LIVVFMPEIPLRQKAKPGEVSDETTISAAAE